MGRASRKASGSASMRESSNPVRDTARANDYLDLDTYAEYGVLSESMETYLPDSDFSEEDLRLALDTVSRIEQLAVDRETRNSIHEAPLSSEGLQTAEIIFRDLGDSLGGERSISENFDPDNEFISQDDSDHMYALSAYMRAIRESLPVRGRGTGMGDSRLGYYTDIVDRARALSSS